MIFLSLQNLTSSGCCRYGGGFDLVGSKHDADLIEVALRMANVGVGDTDCLHFSSCENLVRLLIDVNVVCLA